MSINMITGLSKSTASLSALLPRVLRRGSVEYPDMERISEALDDMYGAYVEPIVRKKGEMHCIGLYADFPDDRYITGSGNILENVVSLACGVLLTPNMQNDKLREDYLISEKKNLIDDIRAAINDKRGYAVDRLLEEMCADEAYGVSKLGAEPEAEAITAQSLTAHHRDIIDNSIIKIIYCGCAEPARVEDALRASLGFIPARASSVLPATEIILRPRQDTPRRFTQSLDVTQGKLTIGFRLGKMMDPPDYPIMSVFNAIYGGSVSSKLFLNVREKLSLCYYANSVIEKHKGIMVVSSGVDFSKFDMALDEILEQLSSIKRGDISDWEFQSAKRTVVTGIKSAMDRPAGLDELYFDSSVSAIYIDPDDLCDMVEAVTLDDVVETASEIDPDSIYFLRD